MTPTGHDSAQSIAPPPHRPAIPVVLIYIYIYIYYTHISDQATVLEFLFPRFLQNEGDCLQVERHNIPEIEVKCTEWKMENSRRFKSLTPM